MKNLQTLGLRGALIPIPVSGEPSPPGTLRVPLPRTVEECMEHRQYPLSDKPALIRWQAPLYRGGRGTRRVPGGEGSPSEAHDARP